MVELIKKSRRYREGVAVVAYHQEGGNFRWWIDLAEATTVGIALGTPAGVAYAVMDRYLDTPEQQALRGRAILAHSESQIAGYAAAADAIGNGIGAVGGAVGGAIGGLADRGRNRGGGIPNFNVH